MPNTKLARWNSPARILQCFALAWIASCDLDSAVPANLPPPVSKEVTTAGATIAGPSGTAVTFPPGAITDSNTVITVTQLPAVRPPAGSALVAEPIRLEPAGKVFEQPVEVVLPVNVSALPPGTSITEVQVLRADQGTTDFVVLPTRPAGPSAVAAVTEHFSDFAAVAATTDAGLASLGACGDDACDATGGESCDTCPADCGLCFTATNAICGDLTCEGNETCPSCPYDCPCTTPCQVDNGGCAASATCSFTGTAIVCACPAGTQDVNGDGTLCTLSGGCAANSCLNGGTCSAAQGGIECTCPAGFVGARCETAFDPCSPSPCRNAGVCVAYGGTSYGCDCVNGYTGADCSGAPVGPCATSPCGANGACNEDGSGGYTCTCATGFTGAACAQDVNECATGMNNCASTATCTNTFGGFTCACNAGYVGDGVTCADANDCATNPCVSGTCIDGVGSFTCVCNPDFTGTLCDVVIDDCATNPCANGSTCIDGILSFTCMCPTTFMGTLCDQDVDECTFGSANCSANATCTNTFGGFSCACNAGYVGDGVTCVLAASCQNGVLDAGEQCDDGGSAAGDGCDPTCLIETGWTCSGSPSVCTDVDECLVGNGGCDPLTTCTNVPGSRTCGTCPAGYTGDGLVGCTDVDECALATDNCSANAVCTNVPASFTCTCATGYAGDGVNCTDVDECATNTDNCDLNATCTNTPGSFTCTCNGGFTGAGTLCTDVDECATGSNNCSVNGVCANVIGSFTCTCATGYTGDGVTCTDVNECLVANGGCDVNATCTNTAGSNTCACNAGYVGNGITCSSAVTCGNGTLEGAEACDDGATVDGDGCSALCAVESGYGCSGQPSVCSDLDECALGTANCDVNATCTNTVGSFACACLAGYSGPGTTCTPVDCGSLVPPVNGTVVTPAGTTYGQTANYGCNGGYSASGSVTRVCQSSGTWSGTAPTCVDVNECLTANGGCSVDATCTNTVGSFTCACNAGFTGSGVTCTDVDECTNGTNNCAANAACTNTVGSFTCACNPGFTGNGVTCTDLDECALGTDNCSANATCANTPGGFTCTCNGGYVGNGVTCTLAVLCGNGVLDAGEGCDDGATTNGDGCSSGCFVESGYSCAGAPSVCSDQNECVLGTNNCSANASCTNTVGSFTCTCNAGYVGDGVNCSDVDECALGTDNCSANAACANVPGSFTCTCNSGFTGNGVTCTDLDECALGTDNCSANAACTNTAGSFTCTCNAGFTGDGVNCTDLDECATGTDNCSANAACTNTVGSFTCACSSGFTGNGVTCTDVDECLTNVCDPSSTITGESCMNMPGTYSCTCPFGYVFDGVTCVSSGSCGNGVLDGAEACDDGGTANGDGCSNTCAVESGYACAGAPSVCTDQNECALGTDNCSANAACTNTIGSFTCSCNTGYTGNGVICTDIDECALGTNNCSANAACTNTIGSFTCTCNSGFTGNGVTCTDVDECTLGTDNCAANAACTNTVGSFTCTCNLGFTGNGVTCTDVDECSNGTNNCSANAACTNTFGSFTCACNSGYTGTGVTCMDVNECLTNVCDPSSTITGESCVNMPGTYSCTCPFGYLFDGITCVSSGICGNGVVDGGESCDDGGTANGDGCSSACAVESGYTCAGAPSVCTDQNECALGTDNCSTNAACTNTVGGFTCSCNSGFTGNGVACADVDECATGTDNCSLNATCANTVGSFTCSCNSGFFGTGTSCTAWSTCPAGTYVSTAGTSSSDRTCSACSAGSYSTTTNASSCTAWTTCTPGSYVSTVPSASADRACSPCPVDTFSTTNNAPSCTSCGPGYGAPGGATGCSDVNECLNRESCDLQAVCTNMAGTYSCSCLPGFTGNGVVCSEPYEQGLLLHYTFDDGAPSQDSAPTGLARDLTQVVGVISSNCGVETCLRGSYLKLNGPGSPDYASRGDDDDLDLTSPELTVQVWVRFDGVAVDREMVASKHEGYSGRGWSINRDADGRMRLDFFEAPSVNQTFVTPSPVTDTAYHQVVLVKRATTYEAYFDSVLVGSGPVGSPQNATAPLELGWRAADNHPWLHGGLDEIAIWNRGLSPAEISTLYGGGAARTIQVAGSCADIIADNAAAPSGRYYLDLGAGGPGYPVQTQCQMSLAGGSWTRCSSDVLLSGNLGSTYQYLYVSGGSYYKSPISSLAWSWSSFSPLPGTYEYWNGVTLSTFDCSPAIEAGDFGIGCSEGPGANEKVVPISGSTNPTLAQATICQDVPNAFGTGPCAGGTQIFCR